MKKKQRRSEKEAKKKRRRSKDEAELPDLFSTYLLLYDFQSSQSWYYLRRQFISVPEEAESKEAKRNGTSAWIYDTFIFLHEISSSPTFSPLFSLHFCFLNQINCLIHSSWFITHTPLANEYGPAQRGHSALRFNLPSPNHFRHSLH